MIKPATFEIVIALAIDHHGEHRASRFDARLVRGDRLVRGTGYAVHGFGTCDACARVGQAGRHRNDGAGRLAARRIAVDDREGGQDGEGAARRAPVRQPGQAATQAAAGLRRNR
jgi:hypothetical protein